MPSSNPLTGTFPLPFGTHLGSPHRSPGRRLIKTRTQVALATQATLGNNCHLGNFRPFWFIQAILDDDDFTGDPWQQYMAAQMAVGGGYSPHMYSHRWVAFSEFSCFFGGWFLRNETILLYYRSYSSLLLQSRPREWGENKFQETNLSYHPYLNKI